MSNISSSSSSYGTYNYSIPLLRFHPRKAFDKIAVFLNPRNCLRFGATYKFCIFEPLSKIPSCLRSIYAIDFITRCTQKALAEKKTSNIKGTTFQDLPVDVVQRIALFSDFQTLLKLALTSKYYFRMVFLNLPYSLEDVKISEVMTFVRIEASRKKCLFQDFKNWGFSEKVYNICYSSIPIQVTNELFQEACEKGVGRLVKDLLVDSRIDPAINDNNALKLAAENGHEEVVWRLLFDESVDPTANDSEPLCLASKNGHAKVVKLLLKDKRADPAAYDSLALRWASRNGHAAVVDLLLKDKRVDPAAYDSHALYKASANGHAKVVELLLKDGRADPAAYDSHALRRASRNGHAKVVDLLLKDGRANPAAQNNRALRLALKNKHDDVVALLLNDERINPLHLTKDVFLSKFQSRLCTF